MANNGSVANQYTKKRLKGFIILISMIVALCIIVGLIFIFAYLPPKNLQETTGTIKKFEQRNKTWDDYIFNSTGAYFRVWFTDGKYFEATGIAYDNIDKDLFGRIEFGDEIKITYDSRFGGSNRIYAIEHDGVNYLSVEDVISDFEDNSKVMTIIGAIIIALSTVAGGVALFIVCKKYKQKRL